MHSRKLTWALGTFFALFLLFLYGPMLCMVVLSFQGPDGGVSFPAKGLLSLHWYSQLAAPALAPLRDAARASLSLSAVVALVTGVLSLSLGMAFRRRFRGSGPLFYTVLLSLMTPGILLSLGLSLLWYYLHRQTGLYSTALGVQTVWALPFGFLVMMAVFNRYDARAEEAARDLGAGALRTFGEVTMPIVWTGVFGAALFGFTLALNEFDRTLLVAGPTQTLPLQIYTTATSSALRPYIFALGALTTAVTLSLVLAALAGSRFAGRRRARDASPTTT